MSKEKVQELNNHLNVRIALKKAIVEFGNEKLSVRDLDKAIDTLEESTANLVRKGYV